MDAMRQPLRRKRYHFNVIYNHAQSRYKTNPDTELSLQFVEFLVDTLKNWGYTECYYYDEDALPGQDVFDELFRVVDESEWTVLILTQGFSTNCWFKYCQMAAFRNLIEKTKRNKLIPIMVGKVRLPRGLVTNEVLSFDVDPTTWREGHRRQLKRLRTVFDERKSVADTAESDPIQEHGDGIGRSERDGIIDQPEPSIQENILDLVQNSILDFDGSTYVSNTDGPAQQPDANDVMDGIRLDSDMNPARASNCHFPMSSPGCLPTTDALTNVLQGRQVQTGTGVKPSVTQSNRDQSESRCRVLTTSTSTPASGPTTNYKQSSAYASTSSKLIQPHNLPVSSAPRPLVAMSETSKKLLSPQNSSMQISSHTIKATSDTVTEESGPGKTGLHNENSLRSGQPLNSSEGQSNLVNGRKEEIVFSQLGARPKILCDKMEQKQDVKRSRCEEYPEQRMNELKFDQGGQPLDYVSLSVDQDITLDQEWSNQQHENIMGNLRSSVTDEQMRPDEQSNYFNQGLFEPEGPTLDMESLVNCSYEPGESTEPKQIPPSSDAGYISDDDISNNHSMSSSHHRNLHWEVHTHSSDGRGVKPSSVESDPNAHVRNSQYSGDVNIENNQMDVMDQSNNERLFSARGKESKPEKVTDNQNDEDQVHVRGEGPKPLDSEAGAATSIVSTLRSMTRGNTERLVRVVCNNVTDRCSSWF